MEEHEAVEVDIERVEKAGFVQGVVVFDVGGHFQHGADAIFDNGAEGVDGGSFGEGEFRVAVGHGFGSD